MQFDEIAKQIDEMVARNGPDFADSSLISLFTELNRDRNLTMHLNSMVSGFKSATYVGAQEITTNDAVILWSSPHIDIAIVRRRHNPRTLSLTPFVTLDLKLDSCAHDVDVYSAEPAGIDNSIFDTSATLSLSESFKWQEHSVLSKLKLTDCHHIKDASSHNILSLRLNSKPIGDFEWVFDRNALTPQRHVCVHPGKTNLQTIFELLGDVRDHQRIPFLMPFTKHKLYFIRWRAVMAISSIDPSSVTELLREARRDSHPAVMQAAERELDRLGIGSD